MPTTPPSSPSVFAAAAFASDHPNDSTSSLPAPSTGSLAVGHSNPSFGLESFAPNPSGEHPLSFLSSESVSRPSATVPATSALASDFPSAPSSVEGGEESANLKLEAKSLDPVILGTGIAVVYDPLQLCCATVGASGKFCIHQDPCPTILHAGRRREHTLLPGVYLRVLPISNNRSKHHIFDTPFVPLESISPQTVQSWVEDATRTREEWMHLFSLINSLEGTALMDPDEFEYHAEHQRNVKMSTKTPLVKKRKPGFQERLMSDDALELDLSSDSDDDIPTSGLSPSIDFIEATEWSQLSELAKDERNFNVGNGLAHVMITVNKMSKYLKDNKKRGDNILSRVISLETVLGEADKTAVEQGNPTVWGSLSSAFHRLTVNENSSSTEASKAFKKFLEIKEEIASMDRELQGAIKKLGSDVKTSFDGVKILHDGLESRVTVLEQSLLGGFSNPSGGKPKWWTSEETALLKSLNSHKAEIVRLGTKVTELTSRVDRIKSPTEGGGATAASPSLFSSTVFPAGHSSGGVTFTNTALTGAEAIDVTSKLKIIEEKLVEIFKKLSGQEDKDVVVVQVGSYSFSGVPDVQAWAEKYLPSADGVPPFGLFVCPINLLFRVWVRATVGSFSLKEVKVLQDLQLSVDESIAIRSCQGHIPPLFTGGFKKDDMSLGLGDSKSMLPGMKKYSDWYVESTKGGIRGFIELHLPNVIRDIRLSIQNRLEFASNDEQDFEKAALLATNMLERSELFIEKMMTFFSATYTELVKAKNSEADSFYVVTHIINRIFTVEFAQARTGMANSVNAANPSLTANTNLWGTFRTMAVVEEFMKGKFEDHRSVTASYVKYAIQNSAAGKVKVLEGEVEELRKSLKLAQKTADSATSQVNTLKNELAQFKTSVNAKIAEAKRSAEGGRGGRGGGGRGGSGGDSA